MVGGRGSVHAPYVDPVVLVDVPTDNAANTQETFGPTLTITRVRDADEAIELANSTGYGLAGAIFGEARAMELARRMRSGMTSINSVIAFASVPQLPFGGVGESGFGRIHGADGLREFTRSKSITRQRFALAGAIDVVPPSGGCHRGDAEGDQGAVRPALASRCLASARKGRMDWCPFTP